eukprot:GEZU01024579.1.p1 GENE.GEZU01024579.1~~GEZU01024579.1.p1  ORF type:complete len:160 (-),score=2.72 GEZU01024579.1:660-1139(-)
MSRSSISGPSSTIRHDDIVSFRIARPLDFLKAVDIMKEFSTNVNIDISEHGLQVLTTDSSNILLFHLSLSSGSAIQFLGQDRPDKVVTIGVNLDMLHRCLKNIKSGDQLVVAVPNDDKVKLVRTTTRELSLCVASNPLSEFSSFAGLARPRRSTSPYHK